MTSLAKRLNSAQLTAGLRGSCQIARAAILGADRGRGRGDFFLSATGNTRIRRLGAAGCNSDDHHVQANLPAAKTTTHTMRNKNIETAKLACFLNSLRPLCSEKGYDFENHSVSPASRPLLPVHDSK